MVVSKVEMKAYQKAVPMDYLTVDGKVEVKALLKAAKLVCLMDYLTVDSKAVEKVG